MNIDFNTFKTLIEAIKRYYELIGALEKALGNSVVLVDYYDLPTVLLTEIELATGLEWTDEIYECINLTSAEYSVESIWKKIQDLKGVNNNDL